MVRKDNYDDVIPQILYRVGKSTDENRDLLKEELSGRGAPLVSSRAVEHLHESFKEELDSKIREIYGK